MNPKSTYTIGIDEAGRGPLAGPVAIGAVSVGENFSMELFSGVRDSKKLTEKGREIWFKKIKNLGKKGFLKYKVSMIQPSTIDKKGIAKAIKFGVKSCLTRLETNPSTDKVLLDGSLYAPAHFKNQKTIIGGDNKVKIISAASIMAKVSRDYRMKRLAKKYPKYDFHIHKGYGTASHLKKIKKFGFSPVHRRSFLKNFF